MNLKRNESAIWEELDGGAVVVNPTTGVRWQLNAAATAAWKLCDGATSIAAMSKALNVSRANVTAFAESLAALGLLNAQTSGATFRASVAGPFNIQPLGVGLGLRRRPSPRGNSGPG